MVKQLEYEKELSKLVELFVGVEPDKAKLVEGLIQDAAFLYSENVELKETISKVGMIKINPKNPSMQKQTVAGVQYLKNINSYAVIIKTLNGILLKGEQDDEELSEYE